MDWSHYGTTTTTPWLTSASGRHKQAHEETGRQTISNKGDNVSMDLEQTKTTLMLRNIPCKLKPEDVMKALDVAGFEEKYDFMYLPMNRKQTSNMGYCFVNFSFPADAQEARLRLEGSSIAPGKSTKSCKVSFGEVQGKDKILQHFEKSATLRQGRVFLR